MILFIELIILIDILKFVVFLSNIYIHLIFYLYAFVIGKLCFYLFFIFNGYIDSF
jgi:hypothetical protein